MERRKKEESKRVGRFYIPAEWALSYDNRAQRVMENCIVIRAEYLLATKEIEYVALSPYFSPIIEGEKIPEYRWVFNELEGLRVEKVS